MAIARGAGTEIIRSASFEYVAADTAEQTLIFGVQHHIYTVLSIICYAVGEDQGLAVNLKGYDAIEGTTQQTINIFNTLPGTGETSSETTFIFNDKFSFNGHEPTDFTGPLDSIAKQDAIADQGSSVPQKLVMVKGGNNVDYMVHITFIDQNNA